MARPTPGSLTGLLPSGQITASNGQTITGRAIQTTSGHCIIIPDGVHDVTVDLCDIGRAGTDYASTNAHGVYIGQGCYNITIRRSVIHDCSSGLYAYRSIHPIIFEYNYVYNIRGPFPRGQMVQFNGVQGGSSPSRIRYNLSDQKPGVRYGVEHGTGKSYGGGVEDHINMYDSPGLGTSTAQMTEVAYNHLRGGHSSSNSGSGMILGDGASQSGRQWSHHNTIVNVRNVGIGIAGGVNCLVEDNRIYMDGIDLYTNIAMYVINYSSNACNTHTFRNNRSYCINSGGGFQNNYYNSGSCTGITQTGNVFGDNTLNAGIFGDS